MYGLYGYLGTDGSEMDLMTSHQVHEEANGSGSGTYQDIGTLAAEMGVGAKRLPIVGSVNYAILPKVDGSKW